MLQRLCDNGDENLRGSYNHPDVASQLKILEDKAENEDVIVAEDPRPDCSWPGVAYKITFIFTNKKPNS